MFFNKNKIKSLFGPFLVNFAQMWRNENFPKNLVLSVFDDNWPLVSCKKTMSVFWEKIAHRQMDIWTKAKSQKFLMKVVVQKYYLFFSTLLLKDAGVDIPSCGIFSSVITSLCTQVQSNYCCGGMDKANWKHKSKLVFKKVN